MRQHGQALNQGLLLRGHQVLALSKAVRVTILDPRIAEVPREGVDHQDMVEMTTVAETNGTTPLRQLGDHNQIRAEILGIQFGDQLLPLQQQLAGSRGAIEPRLGDHLLPLRAKDLRGVAKEPLGVAKERIRETMMTRETIDVTNAVLKRRSMIEMIKTDGEDRKKEQNHREPIEVEETILETTEEADRGFTSAPQSAEVCWQDRFSWQICQKQKPLQCGLRCLGATESMPFAWYLEHLLSCRSTKFKRPWEMELQP